jgi:hypothetical protein
MMMMQVSSKTPIRMRRRMLLLFSIDDRHCWRVVTTTLTVSAPPAEASYKAYTQREQDWQQRIDAGDVKVSTARSLRTQLKDIAPMNSESSKIFCPNGPSAAVSPLMENKCGDRQATASVYGRTQDVAGNSVPGFNGGKYDSGFGPSSSLSADDSVGGFPTYNVQKKR